MASLSSEDDIIEEREELMASATGGIPCVRIARFLKPIVPFIKASNLKLPFLSPKSKWPLEVSFNGWRDPQKRWKRWVERLESKHHDLWEKAGIFQGIVFSKYKFHRNEELIFGIAERWCSETNTFVFPWGEATITLEDVMILGGLSVLGSPIFLPVAGRELVEAEERLRELHRAFARQQTHNHLQWLDFFMESGRKDEHEAFLSLWLSWFVFPGNELNHVGEHVIPIAVHLSRGTRIALAPAVLASIYRDLSFLKGSMAISAKLQAELDEESVLALGLWAPLQLLQLWVWERFLVFQPEPNFLHFGDMRAARWDNLRRFDIGNVRPIIDSCGDIFLWRPYTLAVDKWLFPKFYPEKGEWLQIGRCPDEELESFARCLKACELVGIDCQELHHPHRVAMQFGFDQDIPAGMVSSSIESPEVAWINYSKPLNKGSRLYLPARLFESDLSGQYQKWWRQKVLVPVYSFEGVLRGQRTLRNSRKIASQGTNINPVSRLQNCVKARIKVEPKDLDVPPGYAPKRKANSETCGKNELEGAGIDADVPPGFPAKPKSMPALKHGFLCKKDHCPIIKREPSAKLQIKEECVETNHPVGFPPKNIIDSRVARPGIPAKKEIKEEDIDFPPELNSKLEQNRSPGPGGILPSKRKPSSSENAQNSLELTGKTISRGNAADSGDANESKNGNLIRSLMSMYENGGQNNCSFKFGSEILMNMRACLKP